MVKSSQDGREESIYPVVLFFSRSREVRSRFFFVIRRGRCIPGLEAVRNDAMVPFFCFGSLEPVSFAWTQHCRSRPLETGSPLVTRLKDFPSLLIFSVYPRTYTFSL